jgi:hypothetical protein
MLDVAYPFIIAGPQVRNIGHSKFLHLRTIKIQHFCAFLNLAGKVVISFDPDIPYEQGDLNVDEGLSFLNVDKSLLIFHELCQQVKLKSCTFRRILNTFH